MNRLVKTQKPNRSEFKNVLVSSFRDYANENITDEEIYERLINILTNMLGELAGNINPIPEIYDIMAFYLINSSDSDTIKESKVGKARIAIKTLCVLSDNAFELSALTGAIYQLSKEIEEREE